MPAKSRSNLYLGLICVAFALLLIFVWIPLDTKTGLVEKVRGRIKIGDALAPTVAAGFVLLGGVLMLLTERNRPDQPKIRRSQLGFIAKLIAVVVASFVIMRFTGPIIAEMANLFRPEPIEYRLLRATPGWKHIGFVLGGVMMVAGVICIVERRFSRRAIFTGLIAAIALIAVFDLPFDDLLLPPNGDV